MYNHHTAVIVTTFDSKVDVHYDAVNMDSLQLPETNMPAMLAPRGNTRLYDTIYERLTVLRDNMRRARSQLARLRATAEKYGAVDRDLKCAEHDLAQYEHSQRH